MSDGVLVTGVFDRIGAPDVRLLEAASSIGPVRVGLCSDEWARASGGGEPRYPLAERRYLLESLRYVESVFVISGPPVAAIPWPADGRPGTWLDTAPDAARARLCAERGVAYRIADPGELARLEAVGAGVETSFDGAVVVTGCFDWLHSGHVRFFQEAARYGPLHVVVGHDANVRQLKGDGHPLFPEQVRRYMVGAVRDVERAWIATGWGWLDAEPEIERIRPAVYLVNRDGDRPEKRAFCEARRIRYVVLERTPHPGLPRRSSTDLRGF